MIATLYEQLRIYRKKIAEEKELSLFMILSNKTLNELVAFQPQTKEELLNINGFGAKKADTYGIAILSIIQNYVREFPEASQREKIEALQKMGDTAEKKLEEDAFSPLNIFRSSLYMLNVFSAAETKPELSYSPAESYCDIAQIYRLEDIAGTGNTLNRSISLLSYLCSHICHNGQYNGHILPNPAKLLDYAWDNDKKYGLNGLFMSYLLRSFLQSQNIKARLVYMFPFSPYDNDNQVVVEAYIPEHQKWIMFDPVNNTYIADSNGILLNIAELRQAFGMREKIFFAQQTAYNQKPLAADKLKILETAYAKNCFFFQLAEHQTREGNAGGKTILIAPDGFDYLRWLQTKNQRLRNIVRQTPDFLKEA